MQLQSLVFRMYTFKLWSSKTQFTRYRTNWGPYQTNSDIWTIPLSLIYIDFGAVLWYGSLVRFFGAVNWVIVNVVIPKPLAQLRNGDYMQELNSAKNSTASHVVSTVPFANSVTRENFVINTFVIKTYFTFVAYMHVYLNICCWYTYIKIYFYSLGECSIYAW